MKRTSGKRGVAQDAHVNIQNGAVAATSRRLCSWNRQKNRAWRRRPTMSSKPELMVINSVGIPCGKPALQSFFRRQPPSMMAGRPGEGDTAPTCTGPLSPISSSGARRLSCPINPPQLGGYYRLVPARQDGLLCPSVARVAKQRYRSRKKKREWDRVQGVYDERCRGAGSNSRCKVVIAPAPCFPSNHPYVFGLAARSVSRSLSR